MSVADLDAIRAASAALAAGDFEPTRELLAPAATWTIPGTSPFAGTTRGRDATLDLMRAVRAASQGTSGSRQLALAEGDGYVFVLLLSEATRNGRSLRMTGVNVIQFSEGKIQSVRQYVEDTAVADEFWS